MKKITLLISLFLLISGIACSKSSESNNPTSPGASAPASLVGTWSGTGKGNDQEFAAIMEIKSHSGANWSGTWKTNMSGTVSGTIEGNTLKYSGESDPPCKGVFTGSGNVAGNHIETNHTMSDCQGSYKVTMSLEKK